MLHSRQGLHQAVAVSVLHWLQATHRLVQCSQVQGARSVAASAAVLESRTLAWVLTDVLCQHKHSSVCCLQAATLNHKRCRGRSPTREAPEGPVNKPVDRTSSPCCTGGRSPPASLEMQRHTIKASCSHYAVIVAL